MNVEITPPPPDGDRAAILAVVKALLERETALARPAAWTLGGWPHRGTGVRDFGRHLDGSRRWALSVRLPWGDREHPGLHGRGDAK